MILPGLRMLLGSKAFLMRWDYRIVAGPVSFSRKQALAMPVPC